MLVLLTLSQLWILTRRATEAERQQHTAGMKSRRWDFNLPRWKHIRSLHFFSLCLLPSWLGYHFSNYYYLFFIFLFSYRDNVYVYRRAKGLMRSELLLKWQRMTANQSDQIKSFMKYIAERFMFTSSYCYCFRIAGCGPHVARRQWVRGSAISAYNSTVRSRSPLPGVFLYMTDLYVYVYVPRFLYKRMNVILQFPYPCNRSMRSSGTNKSHDSCLRNCGDLALVPIRNQTLMGFFYLFNIQHSTSRTTYTRLSAAS